MESTSKESELLDVIIVGEGISGINAAYRIQSELPSAQYAILENRSAIGGTWDLFKYPGIRSDSSLWTFGFAWRPWTNDKGIGDGASILQYVRDAACEHGIDRNIQFTRKLVHANWSSETQSWTWKYSPTMRRQPTTILASFFSALATTTTNIHSFPPFPASKTFLDQ